MTHAISCHVVARSARAPRRERRDDTLAPGDRCGAWCVEREVGRGGMSSVHAAVDVRGQRVAIKIAHRTALGPQLTAETFRREARVITAVAHRGTAAVVATGSHDGRPYLALELLVGSPLGAIVELGQPLPRRFAIDILLELCEVLDVAHARGIVHRDIKLDNVFVLDDAIDDRRVRLLDWGVAAELGKDDPFRGMIAGTLTYVAPEQILGDALTPAADVYSLGVVAFRLLCGRAPFVADTDLAVIHHHLRTAPPRPRTSWADIPAALDDLVVAMLAKTPAERPSLDEVVRVLRAARAELMPRRARRPLRELAAPPFDVLGRPALPVPSLSLVWVVVATALIAFAALLRALP